MKRKGRKPWVWRKSLVFMIMEVPLPAHLQHVISRSSNDPMLPTVGWWHSRGPPMKATSDPAEASTPQGSSQDGDATSVSQQEIGNLKGGCLMSSMFELLYGSLRLNMVWNDSGGKKDHPDGWKSRQSLGVRRRTQFGGREIAGKIMWEIVELEILTERLTYRDDEHYYYYYSCMFLLSLVLYYFDDGWLWWWWWWWWCIKIYME